MKILVTGATGFVGKSLCSALDIAGVNYIPVTRNPADEFYKSRLVIKELTSTTLWSNALEDVDVVIHLANRAHVIHDISTNPYIEYKIINVDTTLNLAEQAIEAGVKRFIYISSVKVNGEFTTLKPFNEADNPEPEDDYGKTKLEAEVALKKLCANSQMELVIIRPPLVYGPGVKANFLNLIKLCNKKLPLPFGAIHNKRSFIYIENLISFLILCITHPSAANQIFLVSDNDDQSTASLISTIRKQLNNSACLIPIPKCILIFLLHLIHKKSLVDRLLNNLQVDISKAQNLLGWKPPFTFAQGIQKTIMNLRNEKNQENS